MDVLPLAQRGGLRRFGPSIVYEDEATEDLKFELYNMMVSNIYCAEMLLHDKVLMSDI